MVQNFKTTEELENFLLDQGEAIVDLMGGEIDRIEMNLRVSTRILYMQPLKFYNNFLVSMFLDTISGNSSR